MRRRAAATAAILVLGIPVDAARALPTGGQVVAGQAAIATPTPTGMAVTQTSSKAVIDWAGFNIGAAESVRFLQPSSSAVALNRVTGADLSAIYGSLTANGQVFLVNPNSVLFGPMARVDVGGLVASSLAITNADFMAGSLTFANSGSAGSLTASKVYDGTTVATITGRTLTGVVAGDDVTLVGGTASFDSNNAGVAKLVTATGLALAGTGAGNYTAGSTATTAADITARPLTIAADAKTKVYGDADPTSTYLTGGMGLVAGDSMSCALARNPGEAVGPHAISQGSLSAGSSYAIAYNGTSLAITPAQLLYLADPASRFIGQTNPLFFGAVTGFRLGDTLASATTGTLAFDSPATPVSPPGAYAIDGSGLTAGNYVFAQAPGNAAALTVTSSLPPVNPPSTATPLPSQAPVANIFPFARLLDPLVSCKNKLVKNDDGNLSIEAECGGG